MTQAMLQCLSHSPLMGLVDPLPETVQAATKAIGNLRDALQRFDPEVIFLFAPDHYNGFFYDLMPPFCIGVVADSIGDFGSLSGPLDVPADLALACACAVLDSDIDCAVSYRMQVDHGFAQPLEMLAGALERYPVVPIFINSVAPPMPAFRRARLLGDAVGRYAATLNKRVLFMASGGLSHNPPVPLLAGASAEVAERLIAGRQPSADARAARQQRTIDAARAFAAGTSTLHPLNPEWDREFLATLCARDLVSLDKISNDAITEAAGASAHEVKSWVAANAAMAAATGNRYTVQAGYYEPIPEWIAGFATLQGQADEVITKN
ncbi:3-carboxyethylcatechol 2,3-dioxygenase [Actimicrobium antarcticum]|uniref:2,3-dihydroxyphenylpropionate/2,3-dihydroxicinnamic acid 1,2-dioxygenase n=1 Tax=Actimicrobium antarcticum TaxID=1051899 RepID=A0ABP7TIN9_9BURK